MRAIARSFSALVLGCSSLALGYTAQADSGVTLVYSTGSHIAYPYAVSNRYYSPRGLYRERACALPSRGHSHGHRYDNHKHGHTYRKPVRWIDRHGYHHRDDYAHHDKRGRGNRHDDRRDQHQRSHKGDDRSYSRNVYKNRDNRY